jgi:hypothetical protein
MRARIVHQSQDSQRNFKNLQIIKLKMKGSLIINVYYLTRSFFISKIFNNQIIRVKILIIIF